MTAWRSFAIGGWIVAVAAAGGAILVRLVTQAPFIEDAFGFGPMAMVAIIAMGLSWASIGAFLVYRRPENAIGRIMVAFGAAYALSMLGAALTLAFVADPTPQGQRLAHLSAWATVLCTTIGALEFLIGFIFPTGRAQSPRWAAVVRLYWLMMLIFASVVLFQPGPMHLFPTLSNPFGFGPDLRAGQLVSPIFGLFGAFVGPVFALSLVSRYRGANRTERQQLKWLLLALTVSALGLGLVVLRTWIWERNPDELGLTVYALAAAGVPVAIAIAILRHNLYDIDRIISRTLGYAVVTGVLGAVFAVTAIGLTTLLASIAQGQSLAVAASTLLALALFGPLRRRAQRVIDRHYDRAGYDAALTVQALTARLRDDVDINRLEADVLGVVHDTFRPSSAAMWLRRAAR